MFELNRMLIRKMGWSEYREGYNWGQSISFSNVAKGFNIIYYIQPENSKKTFIIAEYSDKQNIFVEYKFISLLGQSAKVNFEPVDEFTIESNSMLMKLIMQFESCKAVYQRHFKLNRILK